MLRATRSVLGESDVRWAGSHTIGHTVATWMDRAAAPLAEIGAQLGHGDLNVTARYLGRATAPTRAASITEWGGWGSNPRPKDYESSALTD